MFETIVWATDGSDRANSALPFVRELARDQDARLVITRVTQMFATHISKGEPVYADEDGVQAAVQALADGLVADGIKAEADLIKFGPNGVAAAIADAAHVHRADVIVAGTRGHPALGGLFVGSVTQRLLAIAPCPVLVVPVDKAGERNAEVAASIAAPPS